MKREQVTSIFAFPQVTRDANWDKEGGQTGYVFNFEEGRGEG